MWVTLPRPDVFEITPPQVGEREQEQAEFLFLQQEVMGCHGDDLAMTSL